MPPAMLLTEDAMECTGAVCSFAVISSDFRTLERGSFSRNGRLCCEFPPPGPGTGWGNLILTSSRAVRLLSEEEAWRSGRISTV